MGQDFHVSAFEESTHDKLALYKAYLFEWLPVFAATRSPARRIQIFDFFCGPGVDKNGHDGTPLIALKSANKYSKLLSKSGKSVHLYFFDKTKKKTVELNRRLESIHGLHSNIQYYIEPLPFEVAFQKVQPLLNSSAASLILIDQTGIKYVTPDLIQFLASKKGTDLIFFSASSFSKRFCDHPAFQKKLPIDKKTIKNGEYAHIHRDLCDGYRDLVPKHLTYYLAPYSLKRGSNIHGLVFGSSHIKGLRKFLDVCWKADPLGGEANFNIGGDTYSEVQGSLFPEHNKPKKISDFQEDLRLLIEKGDFSNDKEIYVYTLRRGMLPKHAKEVVMSLYKANKIQTPIGKQPRISEEGYKNPRRILLLKESEDDGKK